MITAVGKYIFTSSINVFMPTLCIAVYESVRTYYMLVQSYIYMDIIGITITYFSL